MTHLQRFMSQSKSLLKKNFAKKNFFKKFVEKCFLKIFLKIFLNLFMEKMSELPYPWAQAKTIRPIMPTPSKKGKKTILSGWKANKKFFWRIFFYEGNKKPFKTHVIVAAKAVVASSPTPRPCIMDCVAIVPLTLLQNAWKRTTLG